MKNGNWQMFLSDLVGTFNYSRQVNQTYSGTWKNYAVELPTLSMNGSYSFLHSSTLGNCVAHFYHESHTFPQRATTPCLCRLWKQALRWKKCTFLTSPAQTLMRLSCDLQLNTRIILHIITQFFSGPDLAHGPYVWHPWCSMMGMAEH